MAVEEVEVYEYEGGTVVDPKSDTKVIFIPSPPTKMEQKINPRPAVILFGDADVEELKVKADEEKVVFVLGEDEDETVEATFKFTVTSAKKLNVKKDEVTVKYVGDAAEAAQAFVDYAVDELDAEFDDAEEL
ncbi:MAG: hypothetical protein E7Z98_03115 [Olsenella sp.]|nr:hypothetical protein [Olsenella sp.]